MLNSPRWLFLREIYPPIDRLALLLERKKDTARSGIKLTRDYTKSINYSKLPKNIVYGLFIVFLGYFAAFTIMLKLDNPGMRVASILTGSMEPAIKPGSLIITTPIDTYRVGDIITYREVHYKTGVQTNRAITHRIIATREVKGNTYYIAKGDANRLPDINDIKSDMIYGKVMYTLPLVGYLYSFARTVPGFLLLIALPAYLIIKNEIVYIRRFLSGERKKNLPNPGNIEQVLFE